MTRISILPGIRILVSDEFVARIDKWQEAGANHGLLTQAGATHV